MATVTRINAGTDLRLALRHQIERAIEAALDTAHRLIAVLDDLTGDPDFEPGADFEDGSDAEPALAALVTTDAQIRWVGFEMGAAA